MKFLLVVVVSTVLALAGLRLNRFSTTINPLIGDESYIKTVGHKPDATTDETFRIRTHLEYVENLLRNRPVTDLSIEHQKKRFFLLDKLHEYWKRGIFPKNYDYKEERKPCFIDKDGSICAVGFLIEQTAGREAAEMINSRYQYATIFEMEDPNVLNWIEESGLTREECQMIQPQYSFPVTTQPEISDKYKITNSYAVSSALLNGANVALMQCS